MFIVQQEVIEHGVDGDFTDEFYYFDYDEDECSGYDEGSEEYEKFQQMDEDGELPSNVVCHGMRRRWEFVQAFFTESAAQEYMEANIYHFSKARVYGWTSNRNYEFREIRNAIIQGEL